jgi:hypothetical protein
MYFGIYLIYFLQDPIKVDIESILFCLQTSASRRWTWPTTILQFPSEADNTFVKQVFGGNWLNASGAWPITLYKGYQGVRYNYRYRFTICTV